MIVKDSIGKVIIVGDLFPTEENCSYFTKGDIHSLFGDKICQLFRDANLTICNLEGALTNHPDKSRKTGPVKLAPTSAVEAYKKIEINYCMLANNHATDGGHQGMLDTMLTLDNAGINYIGAGKNQNAIVRSFVQEIGGMRIGFYNVSETMYNKPTKDKAGAWLYYEYVVSHEREQELLTLRGRDLLGMTQSGHSKCEKKEAKESFMHDDQDLMLFPFKTASWSSSPL